jgi:hypothetical protein
MIVRHAALLILLSLLGNVCLRSTRQDVTGGTRIRAGRFIWTLW